MHGKSNAPRRNVLGKYEGANLLFFMGFILVLGVFVAWVFHSYKSRNDRPPRAMVDDGIVTEAVSEASGTCLFYLGTRLSEANKRYASQKDIPATDDGLVRDLLAVSGVVEVVVDQRMVVLQKSPSAHWEAIQPRAREVIRNHLHLHK